MQVMLQLASSAAAGLLQATTKEHMGDIPIRACCSGGTTAAAAAAAVLAVAADRSSSDHRQWYTNVAGGPGEELGGIDLLRIRAILNSEHFAARRKRRPPPALRRLLIVDVGGGAGGGEEGIVAKCTVGVLLNAAMVRCLLRTSARVRAGRGIVT